MTANNGHPVYPLLLQLLSDWLTDRTGHPVALELRASIPETEGVLIAGTVGDRTVAAALCPIAPLDGDGPWHAARRALEGRIAPRLDGGYLIWVPQLVELPEREPHSSELVLRAEETLKRFMPGGHGEIRFPVPLYLRKSDAEGSYITARGGLAPVWAQFTNRVAGHFQLDSTELHRLPAGEGYLTELIERIIAAANGLELGQTAEIVTEDAWVAQRLRGSAGVALIGEPPGSERSSGAGLRRFLRAAIGTLRGPLLAEAAQARLVLFVGPYTSMAQQPVATALLGFDPALHRGLDLLCLAAEGTVKPLLDLTRSPVLAPDA